MRSNVGLLAVLVTVLAAGSTAAGHTASEPVQCSIENQSPSVPQGVPASYVVHLSGGLGTYDVNLVYGDGQAAQGTYTSTAVGFNHIFGATGSFSQTASVAGAGSQTTCSTTTSVY